MFGHFFNIMHKRVKWIETICAFGKSKLTYFRPVFHFDTTGKYLGLENGLNTMLGIQMARSSHPRCSVKKVIRSFAMFKGKHLFRSLFLIKLQAFRPATLLKRDFNTGVFPVNIAKFLKTTILKNMTGSWSLKIPEKVTLF